MTTKTTTRKQVTQLQAGDIIDPPAGEKTWLWKDGTKRRYTVQSIGTGKRTAKGQFVRIFATCPSPYNDEQPFEINCDMLESKIVTVR